MTKSTRNLPDSKYFLKSEDAVAEVLDFITVLGILLVSLGVIGLVGYPVLKNSQETRYIENTRQTFVVVAENLNKVALGQSPSKSLEIKLYGGQLSATRQSRINIKAKNSTNDLTLIDQQLGTIQNSIGDTVVAYEGTGVWIKYPNGYVLEAYKPFITYRDNVLVIPVVKISGNYSVSGTGMSRIKGKGVPQVIFYKNVNNITINITGNNIEGWKNYFDEIDDVDFVTGGGSYTARLNSSKDFDVYILNTHLYTEIE